MDDLKKIYSDNMIGGKCSSLRPIKHLIATKKGKKKERNFNKYMK